MKVKPKTHPPKKKPQTNPKPKQQWNKTRKPKPKNCNM